MAVSVDDIRGKFTEFKNIAASDIQAAIDEAGRRVNTTVWGNKADDGITWLTGHLLVVFKKGSKMQAGPVTSKKVSKLSLTFATGAALTNEILGATAFGREYIALRGTIFAPRVL
jgi:hypothetical protein